MTGDHRPLLTVVIAATDSPEAVDRALNALEGQGSGRIEVIVVAAEAGRLGSGNNRYDGRIAGSSPHPMPPLPNPPPRGGRGPDARSTRQGKSPFFPPLPPRVGRPSLHQALAPPPLPLWPPPPSWGRVGERGRTHRQESRDEPGFRPSVRRITAPPGSGVPRLRRLGLEAARGRVVAFTEDSCLAEPGWADAWISSFDDPALVAGSGPVDHAEDASTLDWAVVFCEYAPFLASTATSTGPPSRLAGNNFAALRSVALRCSTDEVHETALLAAIYQAGGTVRAVDAAQVRHVRRFGWGEAFGDRLRFGLEYGRLRTVGASPIARWAGLVAGPAILAAQVARLSGTILRDRRHPGRFARALPITLALLAAWSLGEWAGWCLGPPLLRRPPARRRRGTTGRTPGPRPARGDSPRPGCKPGPPAA